MEIIYQKLNKAIKDIDEDLFEEISLKDINQILGYNSIISNSIFQLFTGYTISDYIRKRRLSEAVLLLGSHNLIDIAFLCGYESREGFSRAFKSFHGRNPSSQEGEFKYLAKIYFEEPELGSPNKINIEFVNGEKFVTTSNKLSDKKFFAAKINLATAEEIDCNGQIKYRYKLN